MKKIGHLVLCFFLLLSCSNEKSELSVLPSDWIQLTTSENGELTIFNSCDNGNRKLKIEKLTHGISLQTYGEQEDNNFTVNSSSWVGDTLKNTWFME